MKKIALFLSIVMLVSFSLAVAASAAYAPPFEEDLKTEAIYVVNLDTGIPVYEKNIHNRMYPASLTKILAAVVAIENIPDLKDTMITAPSYVYDEFAGISISHANIQRNETLSADDLVNAMIIQSANEAANIVADYVGDGSIPKFVDLMNEKAKELGAYESHFTNPHGLYNDDHYTSAYDMYLIARYAMSVPGFMDIAGTQRKQIGPSNQKDAWNITNRIGMMDSNNKYYYSAIKGIKTGTLDESGRCLLTVAEKDGYSYMIVMLKAPQYDTNGVEIPERVDYLETRRLYDWAFDTFKTKTILTFGESVGELPIELAWDKSMLKITSAETFSTLLPVTVQNSSIQMILEMKDPQIIAPVAKAQELGILKLILAGEEIGRVKVMSGEEVARSNTLYYLSLAKQLFKSFWFKFVVILIAILIVFYIIIMLIRNYNQRRFAQVRKRRRL